MHWLRVTNINKDAAIGFDSNSIIIKLNAHEYIALSIRPICKKAVCDAIIIVYSSADEYKPSKDIICNVKIHKTDGFHITINNDIVVISIFDVSANRIDLVKINFKEKYIFYYNTKENKYF